MGKRSKKAGFDRITCIFQNPYFYYYEKTDKNLLDYEIEFKPTFSNLAIYNKSKKYTKKQNLKIRISIFTEKLKIYICFNKKKLVKRDYDEICNEILKIKSGK